MGRCAGRYGCFRRAWLAGCLPSRAASTRSPDRSARSPAGTSAAMRKSRYWRNTDQSLRGLDVGNGKYGTGHNVATQAGLGVDVPGTFQFRVLSAVCQLYATVGESWSDCYRGRCDSWSLGCIIGSKSMDTNRWDCCDPYDNITHRDRLLT